MPASIGKELVDAIEMAAEQDNVIRPRMFFTSIAITLCFHHSFPKSPAVYAVTLLICRQVFTALGMLIYAKCLNELPSAVLKMAAEYHSMCSVQFKLLPRQTRLSRPQGLSSPGMV